MIENQRSNCSRSVTTCDTQPEHHMGVEVCESGSTQPRLCWAARRGIAIASNGPIVSVSTLTRAVLLSLGTTRQTSRTMPQLATNEREVRVLAMGYPLEGSGTREDW